MNYLWQHFNIKTFPAETIVFVDGVFNPDLSTLESFNIDKKYELPVHIIYVGQISGSQKLEINLTVPEQKVFLTVKIKNTKPVFLNILVKNTGKDSFFYGKVLVQNYSELEINNTGIHGASNTGIVIQTKIVAHNKSVSKLIGIAKIEKNCTDCESDVGFSALAAKDARIEFRPQQFISAEPLSAEHSASLYRGTVAQIEYLCEAGLSSDEIKTVLEEAFTNDLLFQ